MYKHVSGRDAVIRVIDVEDIPYIKGVHKQVTFSWHVLSYDGEPYPSTGIVQCRVFNETALNNWEEYPDGNTRF